MHSVTRWAYHSKVASECPQHGIQPPQKAALSFVKLGCHASGSVQKASRDKPLQEGQNRCP